MFTVDIHRTDGAGDRPTMECGMRGAAGGWSTYVRRVYGNRQIKALRKEASKERDRRMLKTNATAGRQVAAGWRLART